MGSETGSHDQVDADPVESGQTGNRQTYSVAAAADEEEAAAAAPLVNSHYKEIVEDFGNLGTAGCHGTGECGVGNAAGQKTGTRSDRKLSVCAWEGVHPRD